MDPRQSLLTEAVCEHGWLHLRAAGREDGLAAEAFKVAQRLGEPMVGRKGCRVEVLVPSQIENANTNSLSIRHGLGAFPLHNDGAHRSPPPRFIVLACATPGSSPVPTVLVCSRDLCLREVELRQCKSAMFLVRNGRQSFYSTILAHSRPFIRFDQGCMTPMCDDGKDAMKMIALRAGQAPANGVPVASGGYSCH